MYVSIYVYIYLFCKIYLVFALFYINFIFIVYSFSYFYIKKLKTYSSRKNHFIFTSILISTLRIIFYIFT